jgi:hypothetical protein
MVSELGPQSLSLSLLQLALHLPNPTATWEFTNPSLPVLSEY